ncbi:hypothetical protein GCM10007380_16070 [Gottfriedia solisilvae]|uniref:Uncharacterized protein n=1 Tax=Gottfriedia solisilvae TaxID=1516104 RepID=A0A8J3EXP4_9BACI|nr:hypothetical protein GCM10007380_16070 [Gottfriedia solisilvae]
MEGAKTTSMGDAGNLRPRRLAEEAQGHAPWKAKYLEWKSTFFFYRAIKKVKYACLHEILYFYMFTI